MLRKINENLLEFGESIGHLVMLLIPLTLVLGSGFALLTVVLGIFMGYGVDEVRWKILLVSVATLYIGFGILLKIEIKRKE